MADISVYDEIVTSENVNLIDIVVELEVNDTISIDENVVMFDIVNLDIYETLVIVESISVNDIVIELGAYDDITVVESANVFDIIIELGIVFDEVSIEEFVNIVDIIIELGINDSVAIVEDVNPDLEITVSKYDLLDIAESVSLLDIVVEVGIVYDTVAIAESITVELLNNFAMFLRGYPYIEVSMSNIDRIEFGNGVEQIIDRWGKTKKRFNISFPVSQKADALEVRDYYNANVGRKFLFTEPLSSELYEVTFVENSYVLERRHFDTYFASISLVEVF